MLLPFSACKDKRGFSLLEIIIVISLIAILSGLAVSSIKAYLPRYYLSGAARQVMTDLMLARMQAVSKNNTTTVTFSSTGYTGEVSADISSQFNGVSLSSTGNITFTKMGTTDPVTITLTGSPGLSPKRVEVSAGGRARIR